MMYRLSMLLWLALFASVALGQTDSGSGDRVFRINLNATAVFYRDSRGTGCPEDCSAPNYYDTRCSNVITAADGGIVASIYQCSVPATFNNVVMFPFLPSNLAGFKSFAVGGYFFMHEECMDTYWSQGSYWCTCVQRDYDFSGCYVDLVFTDVTDFPPSVIPSPENCSVDEATYQSRDAAAREECEDYGGTYAKIRDGKQDNGFYCVNAECHDNCAKDIALNSSVTWDEIVDDCCNIAKMEPKPMSQVFTCVEAAEAGGGVTYDYVGNMLGDGERCTLAPAHSNGAASLCGNREDPKDTTTTDTIPKPPNDSTPPGSSTDSGCTGSDCDDPPGSSTDSGCTGSDCDSGGGGTSADSGGGGSSPSGCTGNDCDPGGGGTSADSGGGGFYCDRPENADDPLCKNAGYDSYCSDPAHYNEAFCDWSRKCSSNPHDPACVNPQPPPGGGFTPPPGGGDGDGGDSSGIAGVSCKELKNCDWSTYEEQLKQKNISQEMLDIIKELFPWMQRKSHEDSLLAALRWLDEKDDRKKMIEISETLNGRIFTYTEKTVKAISNMDSMNGIYYYGNLSAASANTQILKGAIDSLSSILAGMFGNEDLFPHICRLNPHLVECGGSGSGGGGGGVDMSGVSEGLAGLGDGLAGLGKGLEDISGGIGESNRLLGRIDSILSSGNGDLLGALDSLLNGGGSCEGDECGNYDGVGDDAFAGLDTSGRGKAYYDSLLSSPGSAGLRDSVQNFTNIVRASTLTPFVDGMACPEADLSVDFCAYFGGGCQFSFCDKRFYVQGKHMLEWFGIFVCCFALGFFFLRV